MEKPRSYAGLKLSVIFSFRNEEDNIPELVRSGAQCAGW